MGVEKKYFGFGVLVLTVIALIFLSGCVEQEKYQQQIETKETEQEEEKTTFTFEEISQHNFGEDCWFVIHDKVYDVTDWIPSHPGGKAILEGCGKDATELFETKPMGSGKPHSQKARNRLNDYYIGDLEV